MSAGLHSRNSLDVALALAELGIRVLPLHTPTNDGGCTCGRASCGRDIGKHPRLRSGVYGATADRQLIRGWFEHWRETNIGAACFERLVVIDVDGADEVRALRELCADRRLGGLRVRTGSPDSHHVWFDHPGGRLRTRIAGSLVRSGPTYVATPPDLHALGSRYAFVGGTLEPPPAWLVDELRRHDAPAVAVAQPATPAGRTRTPPNHVLYGRRVLATAVARIAAADPGSRHSTVNKSAFVVGTYLSACGLDSDEVTAALTAAAESAGLVSDVDREQTARTIVRGLEAGAEAGAARPPRISGQVA